MSTTPSPIQLAKYARIAAQHGFRTTIRATDVLVHIPGIVVATGEPCMSDEPVASMRQLLDTLGY